jgi:hypothetical protein
MKIVMAVYQNGTEAARASRNSPSGSNSPADYTCAANCWWKVRYNYPGETTDTTTWSAYIEGNPVRLIE